MYRSSFPRPIPKYFPRLLSNVSLARRLYSTLRQKVDNISLEVRRSSFGWEDVYDVPAENGWTVFQTNVMYEHGFPRCRVEEHCNDRDIFDKMDDVQGGIIPLE